ncbi:MAG: FAD-linked oxidase C-terminal domain-containing protein [Promethearchaeota archaeon]
MDNSQDNDKAKMLKEFCHSNLKADEFSFDVNDRYFYSQDASPLIPPSLPDVVIRPKSKRIVEKVLSFCNSNEIPVTIRGAGTSLSGNSIPADKGVVIDTTGLNRILEFYAEDRVIVVEPGIVCDDLNSWLKDYGLFFAPDPGSSSVCTIGGMVANNSGGIQAAKYGVTKNHVLWLEIITASGKEIKLGSRVLKSSSPLSIQDLVIGSEGCLAFISRVALKLLPLPEARSTYLIVFKDTREAVDFAGTIQKERFIPNMLEFLDEQTTNAVMQFIDDPRFDFQGKTLILLEIDGNKDEVESNDQRLIKIIENRAKNGKIIKFFRAEQDERENLIKLRKSALPALARLNRSVLIEDCSVLPHEIGDVVEKIKAACSKKELKGFYLAIFGHIGDGNLHPTFVFDSMNATHVRSLIQALDKLYNEIIPNADGSITGEHGIGILKAPYLLNEHKSAINLMNKIKNVFDPNKIMNPFKGKSGYIPDSLEDVIKKYFPKLEVSRARALEVLGYDYNCMKCGFCRNECPSLAHHGWESWSPRARLSLLEGLISNRITLNRNLSERFVACTLCARCLYSCPAGIQTANIFEKFRELFFQ